MSHICVFDTRQGFKLNAVEGKFMGDRIATFMIYVSDDRF